jgi:PAS domain S-box-containing protein/putative nucleotidyltransferase with HDIG domain
MDFQFTPYIVVMLSAAAVCFAIGCYSLRYRNYRVDTLIIFAMMMAITEWLMASALGYATTDPASKITWAKIEYIGVVSVPLLVLIFAVSYSGLKRMLTAGNLILIAIVPAVTLILAWTNGTHGLIWSSYVPYQEGGVMFSNKTYGPLFWVYWAYSYILLLAATVLIIGTAVTANRVFRAQALVLVLGIIVPWVSNAIYVLRISPLGNLDLTPLAFAFTGIVLSLGVIRWRLFNITPTARIAVVEKLADGIVLLNNHNLIIDINPAARDIFGVNILGVVGKHGSRILPAGLFLDELRDKDGKTRIETSLSVKGIARHYELTGTPFSGKGGNQMGRIVILHNVTEIKLMHERLVKAEREILERKIDESERKYRELFDNANDAIIIADTDTGLIIDVNRETELLLGRARDEIINMQTSQIHPAEKAVYYSELFKKHIKAESIVDYDAEIRRKDGSVVPVAISASVVQLQGKSVIQGIFRDMTKRKSEEEALRESQQKILNALYQMIDSMAAITAIRDPFTEMHQRRVSKLSVQIALEMGLTGQTIEVLKVAAIIHDIGKIYVPADILNKPGKLSDIEMGIVKVHVISGYDILKPIEFPWPITDIVLQHHERLDGSGYPSGLMGDEICVEARIMAVADVVEAMISHRPYRPALSIDKALDEISRNAGRLYDTRAVDACVTLFSHKGFKFDQ